MKNKSQRHRESNTFRFKGFHERIKNVKISCRNYILYSVVDDDSNDSEFYHTLSKFEELNLTEKFKDFHRGFGFEIRTLAQVLHFESKIATVLEDHINVANESSLPAILSCLRAFASDIAGLFYEKYFFKFLYIIHNKLDISCNENIEHIFVCYASLITILAKYLKNDVEQLLFKENFIQYFTKTYPWYINDLAAKSLCFIIRQLPNKRRFFISLFKYLENNDESCRGVGSLICASFQLDISNRLHSSTSHMLNILFEILKEPETPKGAGRRALISASKSLASYVSQNQSNSLGEWYESWKDDCKYVWPVLMKHFKSAANSEENIDCDFVLTILSVTAVLLDCRNGQLLVDPEMLISATVEILKYKDIDEIGSDVLLIFKAIVTASHHNLSDTSCDQIFSSIFNSSISSDTVLSLVESIFRVPQFESVICPLFLNYCSSLLTSGLDKEKSVLEVLANLAVYKSAPVRCATELESFVPFILDFSECEESHLMENLLQKQMINVKRDLSNIEAISTSIILIRHIAPLNKEKFISSLKKTHKQIISLISCSPSKSTHKKRKIEFSEAILNDEENLEKVMFLLSLITETLYKILKKSNFLKHFTLQSHILAIEKNPILKNNHNYLRVMDIICQTLKSEKISALTEDLCEELYKQLHCCLSSTKSLLRMLSASIFSSFPSSRPNSSNNDNECENLFEIMVKIEAIPPHPTYFKERLRLMRLLEVDQMNAYKPINDAFGLAPLHFMIGQLTIDYKDLWPPAMDGITTYARSLPIEQFWLVWHGELQNAAGLSLQQLNKNRSFFGKFKPDVPALQNLLDVQSTHDSSKHLASRASSLDFRDRLWSVMLKFPEVCEKRGEDVVNLFMNFIEQEVCPSHRNVAHYQDLSKRSVGVEQSSSAEEAMDTEEQTSPEDEVDESETEDESDDEECEEQERKHPFRRAPLKTLCNHIALFAKLNKIKSIYKSRELEKIFQRFLYHPMVSVQKQAMNAVYAFNHKFITPYKDFLDAVIDEKSMRKEITLFSADGNGPDEAHSLRPEHEERLMEILLRILYGKMNSRSTAGKKTKHSDKQTLIVRFLASLKDQHIQSFIALLFDGIHKDFEGDSLDVLYGIRDNFNPKRVVPLKRLKGFLKTINLVVDKMGNLLSTSSCEVLKVTLFVLGIATIAANNHDQIAPHYVTKLKTIMKLATQRLISFFTMFEEYQLSEAETGAIFLCLNPQIALLTKDSLWTSNIFMKLFICWADNPHYHTMLATSISHQEPPFKYIVDVLQHPRCTEAVIADILGIVSHLLSDDNQTAVMVSHSAAIQPIMTRAKENGYPDLRVGEALVYTYGESILAAIHKRLVDRSFSRSDLSILLHICEWVARQESASQLIDVILPILENKSVKEEEAIYLLDVSAKLIGLIDEPDLRLKSFMELFCTLKQRHVRVSLCTAVKIMADRNEDLLTISSWCCDLNSYCPNKIEDEDLERRHSCYKRINGYLETCDNIDEASILCVISNCFFMVENVSVSSLIELSSLSLQNVFEMLSRLYKTNKLAAKLLLKNCLRKLKPLLKGESTKVQTTSWNLLRSAVKHCHQNHLRLFDLYKLYNEKDIDNDFFSNIVHLQLHKRARVLSKMAEKLNNGEIRFQRDTIVGYLMPSVTTYLFNDEYSKHADLITAAITCLGAFAKCLPWTNYKNLLKNYLKVMQRDLKFLRQGVRTLEVIIDAFHLEIGEIEHTSDNEDKKMEVCAKLDNNAAYSCLVYDLIPKIQKVFASRISSESVHKLNKKVYPEDSDIKKISLALTLVKLFQKLPRNIMQNNARNILLRLIHFLGSKAESIRKQAREMLLKVMKDIGPSYLSVCIRDMHSLLERGYQSHVCVFTVYSVLRQLEDDIRPQDIDSCVTDIVEICMKDIFGDQAEEKEVSKIVKKCPEARAERGDSIFGLLSKCIGENHLHMIIKPLYEIAQTSSKSIVNKVAKCLSKICKGLNNNQFISIQSKSIFIYKMYDEKIDEIFATRKRATRKPKQHAVRDCYLLDPEPKIVKHQAKVNIKATAHVFVEFALNLLHNLLRYNKYKCEQSDLELLDAFVPKLGGSLLSEYPGISIHSLNVIDRLMLFPLPSLKEHLPLICKQMFIILDQFSTYSLPKGKNYNMMQHIFTTLSKVLKNITYFEFEADHLKVLIYYARDNLPKSGETHSIFMLLKAMLFRKINISEFHELMKTIQKLSIEAQNVTMLDQARSAYFYYMMNYPKFSSQHISAIQFYRDNLTYEGPMGRMSAILMMHEILSKYPRKFITKLDEGIWLIVSQEHFKEANPESKVLLAKCIKLVFKNCQRKEVLINFCLKLLEDDEKLTVYQNATRSAMVIQSLHHMLDDIPVAELPRTVYRKILPKVVTLLDQKRYNVKSISENELPMIDLYLHSLLELLKILCTMYLSENTLGMWTKVVCADVWKYVRQHLSYPLLEGKLVAATLIDQLFSAYPVKNKVAPPLLDTKVSRKKVVMDLCSLFDTVAPSREQIFQKLCQEAIRNLLYVIRISETAPLDYFAEQSTLINSTEKKFKGSSMEQSTYWLLLHLSKKISRSKSCGELLDICKEAYLNFVAGVIVIFPDGVKTCEPIAKIIVYHLDAQINDKKANTILLDKANNVMDLLKEQIGVMQYNDYRISMKCG